MNLSQQAPKRKKSKIINRFGKKKNIFFNMRAPFFQILPWTLLEKQKKYSRFWTYTVKSYRSIWLTNEAFIGKLELE